MLRFNVKPVLSGRGIDRPNGFLQREGFSPLTAGNIANGKVKSLKLDVLEKLCLALNCTPHDLLEWEPDKSIAEPKKFVLSSLIKEKKIVVLSEELRGLTLAQIEEVQRFVEEKKAGK